MNRPSNIEAIRSTKQQMSGATGGPKHERRGQIPAVLHHVAGNKNRGRARLVEEAYVYPESNKKQRGNTKKPKGLGERNLHQRNHDRKHDKRRQVSDHKKELLLKKLRARRKAAHLKGLEHKKHPVHRKGDHKKQKAHRKGAHLMAANHKQHNVHQTDDRKLEKAYQNQIHRMAAEHKKHAAYLKEDNRKQKDHREEEKHKKHGKYREENPKKHKAHRKEENHKKHRKEQDRENKAHADRKSEEQYFDEEENMHWAEATTTAVRAIDRKNPPPLAVTDAVKTVGVVTTSYFDGYGMAAGHTEDEFRGLGLIGIFEGENAASLGQSLVPNGLNVLALLLLGLFWVFNIRHFS